MSNATARDVMRIAVKQDGYKESPAGSNRTKFGKAIGVDAQPWCASYLWWCGSQASGDNPIAKSANAAYIQDYTVKNKGGSWVMAKTGNTSTKKAGLKKAKFGDIVDFDFGRNDLYRRHTAFCLGTSGDYYITIEGNTSASSAGSQSNGGCVAIRYRKYTEVCSIVRPKYKSEAKYNPTTPFFGTVPSLPTRGYFKKGDSGSGVKKLQQALNWADGSGLTVDGDFGNGTLAAVVLFQAANGLAPDGEFGKASLAALNKIVKAHSSDSTTALQEPVSPAQTNEKEEAKEDVAEEETTVKTAYIPKQGEKCYDLSAWQGELSASYFEGIKKKGVECVILRSSYTKGQSAFAMEKDKYFDNNIKNAIKAGMHIGIYHFSQAKTKAEAKKEAAFCIKCIKPYMGSIDLPVAFDWETYNRLSATVMKNNGKSLNTEIVHSFCDAVKAAGYEPMIYASLVVFNNYLSATIYKELKIWVAQYYSECQYKHPYYMWQFTSNNGKLDENYFGTQDTKVSDTLTPARGYFKKGDKGDDVKKVQEYLNKANVGAFTVNPKLKLTVDGEYGDATVAACKFLQKVRHLTVDGEFGQKSLNQAKKTVTKAMKAINWAVAIAEDNTFAYGTGDRAHHNGCYFCGTNITGPKKAKKGSKWEKTYCCNPFVHAAFAHGVGDAAMLKACKAKKAAGLVAGDWTKFGFKNIGQCKNVKFEDLKKGDVILKKNSHVWLYAGGNYIVEASGGTFNADSIAHKKGAKSRYASYQKSTAYVLRYSK